jgi:16S rRNA C967 or C1407 C5-methylase (RsmB/RsmF family)
MQKKKITGREAFIEYYRPLFDSDETFEMFLTSLEAETFPILRFPKKNEAKLKKLWKKEKLPWEVLSWYPYALKWPQGVGKGTTLPGSELYYVQNASSLLPVLALDPQPGECVLDACAAPGGKALFIAELMKGEGEFVANDLSGVRAARMKKIFAAYGVEEFVNVHHWNAMSFSRSHPLGFDKILLDAPCSSEKHVFNSPKHIRDWKSGRIKHLKKRQWTMLKSLWKALAPGGVLVYSTCAVTPDENELLINKFVQRVEKAVPNSIEVLPLSPDLPHEKGRVHPHKYPNMDPMFVAIFRKTKEEELSPSSKISSN